MTLLSRSRRLLACLACFPLLSSATNVVLIVADDLGYADVGFNNPNAFYETPHLDRLAAESTRFTDAYAASPVCSPTRSSMLTGQHPARTRNSDYFHAPNGFQLIPENYDPAQHGRFGKMANRPVLPAPYLERLDTAHLTLAEAFQQAGYRTMLAGKWHLGGKGSSPEDHGFEINAGGTDQGGPYGGKQYFSPYANPKLPDGPEGEHLPDRLASEVCSFIAQHKDVPFFVYFPMYSVHTPLVGRPDLVAKYEAKRKALALEAAFADEPPGKNRVVQEHPVYAAMVEAMDQAVGKVIACLDDLQLRDETVIVFISDNGGLSTAEGSPTSNLPLRAGKGWMYEGGIRVPLIIHVPGLKSLPESLSVPVISTDLYPTLLESCGVSVSAKQSLDGESLMPLLRGDSATAKREALTWHYPHWSNQGGTPSSAIREGHWKYIHYYTDKPEELFDLSTDLGERTNLAASHPELTRRLSVKLQASLAEMKALYPSAPITK